jgi:Cu/Ag efflux protein CusF
MKKIVLAACLLGSFAAFAQKEFPLVYKTEFPIDVKRFSITEDRTLAIGGSKDEVAVMDAVNGKLVWKADLKEKFGKIKGWRYNSYLHVIEVTLKSDSKEEQQLVYLDEKTGNTQKEVSRPAPVVKKVKKSRKKMESLITIADKNATVELTYDHSLFTPAGGKGRKTNVHVIASGGIKWDKALDIKIIRSMNDFGDESISGDQVSLDYYNGKVFVIYEGISVLDVNTGDLLWETSFDNTEFDFGLFKSTQTLGRAAMPLCSENAVFVADLTKGVNCVKKLDINSGKVLWMSEKLESDVIPEMQLDGNNLIVQLGGQVIVESYIPGQNGNPDVRKREIKLEGDKGVDVYDANSGKLAWTTRGNKALKDKFGGSITNVLVDAGTMYVCSDKNFFAFETARGNVKYSLPVSQFKIEDPTTLFFYKNNIVLEGKDGVASISKADGKLQYATDTKKNVGSFYVGDAYFVWTKAGDNGPEDFVRMDLDSGAILGKMEDTRYPFFTEDGMYFVKRKGEMISRYKTQ